MRDDEILLTLNKSSSPVKSLHLAEENIDWVAYLRQGEPEYVVGVEQPLSVSSDMSYVDHIGFVKKQSVK